MREREDSAQTGKTLLPSINGHFYVVVAGPGPDKFGGVGSEEGALMVDESGG